MPKSCTGETESYCEFTDSNFGSKRTMESGRVRTKCDHEVIKKDEIGSSTTSLVKRNFSNSNCKEEKERGKRKEE